MTRTTKTRFGRCGLAAALLAATSWAGTAMATTTLDGNVAAWVPLATPGGAAADAALVPIVVHMALKDVAGLKSFADAVSMPGNALYGQYLDRSTFAARYAPDAADVTAVRAMLGRAGMTDITVGPLGAYVSAVASVAQIRAQFGVSQRTYLYKGMTMRANSEAPRIPEALAGKIASIEGLDDSTFLKRPQHVSVTAGSLVAPTRRGVAAVAAPAILAPPVADNTPSPYCSSYFGSANATLSTKPGPYDKTLPWLACGYEPQQIQAAYGLNPFNAGLDGRGVTVAIVDAYASPTLQADGNHYAQRHKLPQLGSGNFSQVIPAGIYNVSADEPCGPYGWWTEESLDLASVHGSAPGAKIVYVGARDCGTTLTTALSDSVYLHRADVITNSYSYNGDDIDPSQIAADDQTFMAAAAQGITLLFSSGDDGDLSQINGIATGSYEATSNYVTGVGGTSMLLVNKLGKKTEFGWGTYRDYLADATVQSATAISTSGLETNADGSDAFSFYSGAGGGISLSQSQPAYQVGVVPTALATTIHVPGAPDQTVSPQRVSPDISALADPYTGYLYGETYTIAGDGHSDIGCVATGATTEYCEIAEGGTSLASPLIAGVIATVDEVRVLTKRPKVGFANPWLYKSRIGKTTDSAGINQIVAPGKPLAVLRGYVTDPTRVRVVTINSVPTLPGVCASAVCEGLDDVYNYVTPGYNDVTGLGVPFLPLLALK